MEIAFERLTEEHRIAVIDILNYHIEHTTAAYRAERVGYGHFDGFLNDAGILSSYAIKADEEVIGFCILEYFKNLGNFRKTGDVMYFIKPGFTGKGIGREALRRLERDALDNGMDRIVVDISDGNEGSVRFHEKNGFREYGRLADCWNKFGKKLGIVFMEKVLGDGF